MENRAEIVAEIEQMRDFTGNIAESVIDNPQLLPLILNGVYLEIKRAKFDSINILLIISRKNPEILYPHIKYFVELLDNDNFIITRYAIEIIANLSAIDCENKINDLFDEFYNLIFGEYLVTAVQVVDNSWKIAKAKPDLQNKITDKLLEIERNEMDKKFQNILLGKVILSFDKYFHEIDDKDKVISFVKRQLNNPRNATKVKAERFLRKHSHYDF
jgi:hypothetical protein